MKRIPAAAIFVLLSIPASEIAAQGRLVIAGGGLSRDNAALYQAVLDGRDGDGPICVIPTASADLDGSRRSMTSSVETFEQHGGPGTAMGVLMSIDNPESTRDAQVVEQIRGCSGFYFTGGVQSRTVTILRPEGENTLALDALMGRYEEGAVVGGSSAGAAIMSDPMIAGGSTATAIAGGVRRRGTDTSGNDDDSPSGSSGGVSIGPGIGFFTSAIVDQHFLARGRIGRLIAAVLGLDEFDLGFGVDEDTGLVVDGAEVRAVGASGVVVIDESDAVRDGRSATNLTLHLMGVGDRYDTETRRLTLDPTKRPLPRTSATLEAPADLFARWEFLHLLERFGRSEQTQLTVPVEGGELVLRKGPEFAAVSREGAGVEGTPAGLAIRGLILDLLRP